MTRLSAETAVLLAAVEPETAPEVAIGLWVALAVLGVVVILGLLITIVVLNWARRSRRRIERQADRRRRRRRQRPESPKPADAWSEAAHRIDPDRME